LGRRELRPVGVRTATIALYCSRWACVLSIGCLMLSGCADRLLDRQEIYVVRAQDTLYSIAWRHGLDYHDLARWNGIGPDFRISVGQTLRLAPDTLEKRQGGSAQRRPNAAASVSQLQWVWPTDRGGTVLPVSSGGILLQGHLGQDGRAASAGSVV